MKKIFMCIAICCLSACTKVDVVPLDPSLDMQLVCIERNPAVRLGDFLNILEDGIARHGMQSQVFDGQKPESCEYVLKYTALQSWDMGPYLSHAELRIYKDNRQIASAIYHLQGKGGFSLMKWQDAKTKMDPVIDELLSKKQMQ